MIRIATERRLEKECESRGWLLRKGKFVPVEGSKQEERYGYRIVNKDTKVIIAGLRFEMSRKDVKDLLNSLEKNMI